jgi:hypothetical protein
VGRFAPHTLLPKLLLCSITNAAQRAAFFTPKNHYFAGGIPVIQTTPQPTTSSVDTSDSLTTPSVIQPIDKSVEKPIKYPVTLEEFLDWYPDGYGCCQ